MILHTLIIDNKKIGVDNSFINHGPSLWWLSNPSQTVIIESLHSKPVKSSLRTINQITTQVSTLQVVLGANHTHHSKRCTGERGGVGWGIEGGGGELVPNICLATAINRSFLNSTPVLTQIKRRPRHGWAIS